MENFLSNYQLSVRENQGERNWFARRRVTKEEEGGRVWCVGMRIWTTRGRERGGEDARSRVRPANFDGHRDFGVAVHIIAVLRIPTTR